MHVTDYERDILRYMRDQKAMLKHQRDGEGFVFVFADRKRKPKPPFRVPVDILTIRRLSDKRMIESIGGVTATYAITDNGETHCVTYPLPQTKRR